MFKCINLFAVVLWKKKINDILESKQQLAEQTINSGEDWLTNLDTDQLRELLILERSAII